MGQWREKDEEEEEGKQRKKGEGWLVIWETAGHSGIC